MPKAVVFNDILLKYASLYIGEPQLMKEVDELKYDVAAVFAVDDEDEAVMDGSSSQLLGDLNTQELLLYIGR
nr:beta-1,6-galactosyltransferase GALT29A-like [Ipomoea batatas]